ncbi:DUF2264 domain-containing protein [Microbacterium aurantiacum]|uniref:DUF2264 domain-containing protein n=1 Tax=Microbacterium aurantiacum TaxID=162393 RepID=UPI0040352CB5
MRIEPTYPSWLAAAKSMALPASTEWASPSVSAISSHGVAADTLESFARPFMLTSLVAATGDRDATEVGMSQLALFLSARAGRDESFRLFSVSPSAALPEATSLALALWFGRHRMWEAMEPHLRAEVATWLRESALTATKRANNWVLFGWTISRFLSSVGHHDAELLALERWCEQQVDGWYVGGGWYTDGGSATFDYYNSYAFHYYLYLVPFLEGRPPAEKWVARLGSFLDDLEWLIGPDGAPIRYGRSLTYRFGVAAPLSVTALLPDVAESGAIPRSVLASRVMNYFATREDLARVGGVRLGWAGQQEGVAQRYSGPLASYWFGKSFVALLAGQASSFWMPEWKDAEPKTVARTRLSPSPGFALARSEMGSKLLLNHGSYDRTATDLRLMADDPFYTRVIYSDRSWPDQSDAGLSGGVSARIGRATYVRARPVRVDFNEDEMSSVWSLRRQPGPFRKRLSRMKGMSRIRRLWPLRHFVASRERTVEVSSREVAGWLIVRARLTHTASRSATLRFGVPEELGPADHASWLRFSTKTVLERRSVGESFGSGFYVLCSNESDIHFAIRLQLTAPAYEFE